MDLSMPFEPLDAYESLQSLLPPFCLELPRGDLKSFIIHGFVTRKFTIKGRFQEFGYTWVMRSPDEMTVKSFLINNIPRDSKNPLYKGDAIGFVVDGTSNLYTINDERRLVDLPDNLKLSFVYERPSILQPHILARDLVYHIRYVDEFENLPEEISVIPSNRARNIFQFMNTDTSATPFLIESFYLAIDNRSRFGYTVNYLLSMRGLALVYRILKSVDKAAEILEKALDISYGLSIRDSQIQFELIYDLGAVNIAQENTTLAEKRFSVIEKEFRDISKQDTQAIYLKAVDGLAAASFQDGLLQQTESLLDFVISQNAGIAELALEKRLANKTKVGLVYWAQGQLDLAKSVFEETLDQQQQFLGECHYHSLRTMYNLAGVLSEKLFLLESEMLYTRVLTGLSVLLGSGHLDTLRVMELLAHQYFRQHKFSEASEMWRNLLHSYEKRFGKDHVRTMEACYQLCQSLARIEMLADCIELLQPLCHMNEQLYGSTHPATRRSIMFLSNIHRHLGHRNSFESIRRQLQNSITKSNSHETFLVPSANMLPNMEERLNREFCKKVEGTCTWIFDEPTYQEWINAPSPSILWINGIPGGGKTVLTSAIVNRLKSDKYTTVFFFFDSTDYAFSDPKLFLDSLNAQMLKMKPKLEQSGNFLPTGAVNPIFKSFTKFSELVVGFDELYCCIDAIDDCQSSSQLLQLISDIVKSEAFPIKILLSSRLNLTIKGYIGDSAYVIELPNENTKKDILKFAKLRLQESSQNENAIPEYNSEILARAADGMFLWVELAIKDAALTSKVLDAPRMSLAEMYRNILLSLTSKLTLSEIRLLQTTMLWIMTAIRPLKVSELQIALAVEVADSNLVELRMLSSPTQSIQQIGGPLLRVLPDDTVVPVHQSLKVLLQCNNFMSTSTSSQTLLPMDLQSSDAYISLICVTYLSFDCFRSPYGSHSLVSHSFLDYAAKHWVLHTIRAGKDTSIVHLITSFLHSDQCFNWLDALTTFFKKSVDDILLVQSQISTWISQFNGMETFEDGRFVLYLYRKKIAQFNGLDSLTKSEIGILQRLADIYHACGLFDEAEMVLKRILGIPANSNEKVLFLQVQNRLAAMNIANANTDGLDSSVVSKSVSKATDPTEIVSMSNLASTYQSQGRLDEAKLLQQQVVEIAQRTFGAEHPITLNCMSNLASTDRIQGHWKEAEQLSEEILQIRIKLLGPNHPDTLTSQNDLSTVYRNQGRWLEAEELAAKVLATRESLLGQNHPSSLTSADNMAMILHRQGKYSEAGLIYGRTLAVREIVLGTEHPDTLASKSNLALLLESQGKLDKAEPLIRQALVGREKNLGSEHPDTLNSKDHLALLLQAQGKLNEAELLLLQNLALKKRVLGQGHPDMLSSMNNLAGVLHSQGKFGEAEAMHRESLLLKEELLGKTHPDTLKSMNNLATVLHSQGKFDEAEAMLVQVITLQREILGEHHPNYIKSMADLAAIHDPQGRWKESGASGQKIAEKPYTT